ncbi:MAG: hypothetical protein WBQ94_04940 [Terracidiphilus sp.]
MAPTDNRIGDRNQLKHYLRISSKLPTAVGAGGTVIGCVLLTPGLDELAEAGNKLVKSADFLSKAAGWGACALDAEDFINALNDVATGKPNTKNEVGNEVGESIESLAGCVLDALGQMLKKD